VLFKHFTWEAYYGDAPRDERSRCEEHAKKEGQREGILFSSDDDFVRYTD